MDTQRAASRIGEVVDRYRLEAVLGVGGFGAVFRARHLMMQRDVALKLLHRGPGAGDEAHDRFLREARTLARLGHPNVVAIHDCGLSKDGEAFLAMELLEGEDLASVLAHRGTMPPEEALAIVEDVLSGLAAAHAAGVIHRDLKPANVFLARSPAGCAIKLVDFGISKVEGDRLTRTGMLLGTPVYMAPESVMNGAASADARADLYAVGVILYEMLSGRLPYEAPSYQGLVLKVATDPPAPLASVLPGVDPELSALVERAIAKEPRERFADALEMRAAVARLRGRVASHSTAAPHVGVAATAPVPTPVTPKVAIAATTPAPTPVTPFAQPPPSARRSHPTGGAFGSRGLLLAVLGGAGIVLFAGIAAVFLFVFRSGAHRPAWEPVAPPSASAPVAPVDPLPPKPEAPVAIHAPPTGAVIPEPSRTAAPPPHAPAPTPTPYERGVHLHEPNVVGEAPVSAIVRMVDSARDDLQRCRRARPETVHVHLHVHGGRITLAGPNPNVTSSDVEVARCVANVLRERGPLPSGQGIVQLTIDLAPR